MLATVLAVSTYSLGYILAKGLYIIVISITYTSFCVSTELTCSDTTSYPQYIFCTKLSFIYMKKIKK